MSGTRTWIGRTLRGGAVLTAALTLLLATTACVSVDGGEAQQAVENLTQEVTEALKNGNPAPPDGEPLEGEYTEKTLGGVWDLTEPDTMEDRVSPSPPEDVPAPGESSF